MHIGIYSQSSFQKFLYMYIYVCKKKTSPRRRGRRRTNAYLYRAVTVLFSIRLNRSMKDWVKNRAD